MTDVSVLERYAKHHQLGLDCRLTCLRNVLDYFGIKESYATVFGMSSSFSFVYRKDPLIYEETLGMPDSDFAAYFYPISGHRFDCMDKLAYTYSATLTGNYPDEAERSFDRMRECLANGIPVMVAVSRQVMCEYLDRPYGFPDFLTGIEFGGHWVILVGVDDSAETVTLFETDLPQPVVMPRSVFQRARSHRDDGSNCFLKSRNRWAVFIPPECLPAKRDMIFTALTKTLFHMRQVRQKRRAYTGLHGLQVLAEELPNWQVSEEFSENSLKATVWMLQLQGNVVSSGGLGRKLFANYLHQSARICKNDSLQAAADFCSVSASNWKILIARVAERVIENGWRDLSPDTELPGLLHAIIDAETATMEKIQDFLRRE